MYIKLNYKIIGIFILSLIFISACNFLPEKKVARGSGIDILFDVKPEQNNIARGDKVAVGVTLINYDEDPIDNGRVCVHDEVADIRGGIDGDRCAEFNLNGVSENEKPMPVLINPVPEGIIYNDNIDDFTIRGDVAYIKNVIRHSRSFCLTDKEIATNPNEKCNPNERITFDYAPEIASVTKTLEDTDQLGGFDKIDLEIVLNEKCDIISPDAVWNNNVEDKEFLNEIIKVRLGQLGGQFDCKSDFDTDQKRKTIKCGSSGSLSYISDEQLEIELNYGCKLPLGPVRRVFPDEKEVG